MYGKKTALTGRCLPAAATVLCILCAGDAVADNHEFAVAMHVSTRGLDLSEPAGAQKFYMRLKNAADRVCTGGDLLGMAPVANPKACYENSLADAIRSANAPLVTQAYLATHTIREALEHGFAVPPELAAK